MTYEKDNNWEHVPDWCRPDKWVMVTEEWQRYHGIFEPMQITSQPPIKFSGSGQWTIRTKPDYGIALSLAELVPCNYTPTVRDFRIKKAWGEIKEIVSRDTEDEWDQPIIKVLEKVYDTRITYPLLSPWVEEMEQASVKGLIPVDKALAILNKTFTQVEDVLTKQEESAQQIIQDTSLTHKQKLMKLAYQGPVVNGRDTISVDLRHVLALYEANA
jgi:hypothetical protein